MSYINQQKYGAAGQVVDIHDKRIEDSFDGILKSDGNGNISVAIRGTDYDTSTLPSQSGQSGKFLTTDGTDASWANVDALPSQAGESGKFLTTDGSSASWANVDALPSQTGQSGKFLTTDGSTASWADNPPEVFLTTITSSNNAYTADHTFAQITAAKAAGKLCLVTDGQGVYSAVYFHSTVIVFSRTAITGVGAVGANTFTQVFECSNSDVWAKSGVENQPKGVIYPASNPTTNNFINYINLGAEYRGSGANTHWKITLPAGVATIWIMLYMEISIRGIYTNGEGGKLIINGYHSATSPYTWTALNATVLGKLDASLAVVACNGNEIWITPAVPYSSISVDKIHVGDAARGVSFIEGGVTITNEASLPASYQTATMIRYQEQLPSQSGNSGKFLTTNGTTLSWVSLPTYNGSVI